MKSEIFAIPQRLNMGFHYTLQYSRRTRVFVIGLVDQGSEAWEAWYLGIHGEAAMQEIAAAGYTAVEVHFLYGYGLKGEREEWLRTKELVRNAHKAGLLVFGYFQFFSVQQETFFVECPWARDCVQVDEHGKRIEFRYDRPALCISHPEVVQYYLDGVELGLSECELDGIRLDNDYYKGCYCETCQEGFRVWLRDNFDEQTALRVFGLRSLEGMSLVPASAKRNKRDPLWLATVLFRQQLRQKVIRAISEKVRAVNPQAILGGNPGVARQSDDASRGHVYTPDLGETHHLVCAENSRFPAREGNHTRHQVYLYKNGQANDFKVFASHHIYTDSDFVRWPETREECALSLCEALAFGGHPACTTWGIRMDGDSGRSLWQRPVFLQAFSPLACFLDKWSEWFRDASCDATVGVYFNRTCCCVNDIEAWLSLHGAIQSLLQNQLPFRLVGRDDDQALEGLEVVLIGDMQYVSDAQFERFIAFAEGGGRILMTGQSCHCDEWALKRKDADLQRLSGHPNVTRLDHTPGKIAFESDAAFRNWTEEAHGTRHPETPLPPDHRRLVAAIIDLLPQPPIHVAGSPFIAIDTFSNPQGQRFIHVLNYDNSNPSDVVITIPCATTAVDFAMPDELGSRNRPKVRHLDNETIITLEGLHTYCVVRVRSFHSAPV